MSREIVTVICIIVIDVCAIAIGYVVWRMK